MRTNLLAAVALIFPLPALADFDLPPKCPGEVTAYDDARQRLQVICSERIASLEADRKSQGSATAAFTGLAVSTAILTAGGTAALASLPGIGSAIQAADPSTPAVPDDPATQANEAKDAHVGAQPGPDIAKWQLFVGVTTAILTAATAGFTGLAVFNAPSQSDASALQARVDAARAASNGLILVPIKAASDPAAADKLLADAAEKCGVSNPSPPTKEQISGVKDGAKVELLATPNVCIASAETDSTNALFIKLNTGAMVPLRWVPSEKGPLICDYATGKNCTSDAQSSAFLHAFSGAGPRTPPPKAAPPDRHGEAAPPPAVDKDGRPKKLEKKPEEVTP